MMGALSSKKKSAEAPRPLRIDGDSEFRADLSLYEAACQADSELRSFDSSLHQRTSHVIDTLVTGVEVRSLSFDSLKEVTNCLLEMNQEVVKVILDNKRDIWKSRELFSLVEDYFENSIATLDFCTALERCLMRARNNQLIIQVAVRLFEEELEAGVVDGSKFVKTVEELKKFKEAEAPFTEEFFQLFQSVYKQQLAMLEKLQRRKRKLDKRLKSVNTWRKVSNVLFVSAFVSVLIFSVVAAAIAAPPVVTALAGALAVPIGSVGKWCNSLWKGYQNALKGQRELLSSMQIGTYIVIKDMDNIRVLVNKMEIVMESLWQNTDFALTDEDALRFSLEEIKKNLDVFMKTIEDLGEQAEKCSREIRRARTVVLQRIIKYPGS